MIPTSLLKTFAGVSIDTFDFETEEELDDFLQTCIDMAESLITDYCDRDFGDSPPTAVKNVCLRLAANIVMQAVARQDTDLIRAREYSTKVLEGKVFSDDLKEDLDPHVNRIIQLKPVFYEDDG